MKVLLLKDYFTPEVCAGINLTNDLLETLAASGIECTVVTPIPCRGIDDETRRIYRSRRHETLHNGMVNVYRYRLPYEGKNVLQRAFRYLLQNCVQLIKGFSQKADVLFLGSTPPTNGLVGAILHKVKKIPFIYNVQDIFPDSLVMTGLASENSLVYKIGSMISNFAYKSADHIVVISESFRQNLIQKGVPAEKISIVPNWIDENGIRFTPKDQNPLFEQFGVRRDQFNIVYAGNLGAAQDVEILLKAAQQTCSRDDIDYYIFGSGTQEEELKKYKEEHRLNNVHFLPLQKPELAGFVYGLGDVSVVSCKKGASGCAMPSKTWSIMGAGTAVLAIFDEGSELEQLIHEKNAGVFVPAGDAERLATAILYLSQEKEACAAQGDNGRKYVVENITKAKCTAAMEKIIRAAVSNK